jgi:hypothetical protein
MRVQVRICVGDVKTIVPVVPGTAGDKSINVRNLLELVGIREYRVLRSTRYK